MQLCFTNMCSWRQLLVWIVCVCFCMGETSKLGYMEYKFARQRDLLEEKEKEHANNNIVLTNDEIIADNYLGFLKRQELERTRHDFPPSRPIELVLPTIRASKVYAVLKKLPKGGNMHLHQGHILDKKVMLDIIFGSYLINYLCVNTKNGSHQWELNFYDTPPKGWVRILSNTTRYSEENLLKHVTLLNVMDQRAKSRPTDSETRWKEMGPMFSMAGNNLVYFQGYVRQHLQAMFKAALDENVQYLEARLSGYGLYALNDSYPGGHQYLDLDDEGDTWFTTVREELAKFKAVYPKFIGYRDIVVGKRYKSRERVMLDIDRAIKLRKKYPDIVSGFDLISEEDKGFSLLHFIDDFAKGENQHIPFYFHTAETSWPDDLLTSIHPDDEMSTLENVYEAIILNSKRVGHGLGFIKHPYLMQVLKEKRIAVEANPVSNMLLGYVPDQRHHPAITFIRSGIPVVLGADDPGTMGYNEFTVDWYEAFMAWGLNLKDLKQLANNSFTYSSMDDGEKINAFQKWQIAWDSFIADIKHEACDLKVSQPTPKVFRLFPIEGPIKNVTSVRIFGRNFQRAICKDIVCQFGKTHTKGEFVHTSMVKCPTPVVHGHSHSVDFRISFDSGKTFQSGNNTVLNFTFSETSYHGFVNQLPMMVVR
ncbi:adenosine deaminase AGSA-like isoform X1 [Mya arenaria]|nr:adenosine deaminase AGSA-like isoform X1 [Mya arenaria]XP_052765533.1 adenosine deaminase AGSA-like isoform X1 [Mya arenaria]XP_052765534.1 adenosine deaminase AGSA-like isoform X1 [Mya arenaria]